MNEPLQANDIFKIIIFLCFQSILTIFIVGLIPAILLITGYCLMRRESNIEVLNKFSNLINSYINIVYVCIVIWGVSAFFLYCIEENGKINIEGILIFGSILLLMLATTYLYEFTIEKCFFEVLLNHREWIEKNGIFSYDQSKTTQMNIFKSENLKSYSVADELLKWKKLKDEGLVTNEEYEIMKKKILEK
ncbi:SHOCT domain-containing protein [Acinetobacter thermotolerans]|uniref:SHOCT domain-containing protein n=1 Tax=Acinetobacter thermotolerans TaxID=3151487 RepID=UPI00325BB335